MKNAEQLYHGCRFPLEIISHAVWLYHRFCLNLQDVDDLLAEWGIAVSYESFGYGATVTVLKCHMNPLEKVDEKSVGSNLLDRPSALLRFMAK